MRIAIDGNEANVKEKVGTGEYAYNLLSRWGKEPQHEFHIYLRDHPLPGLPPATPNWQYHVVGPYRGWTRLAFPYHLLTDSRHHVVWNPAHYLPPFTRCPGVVTVHDLAYEFYPELFLREDLYKLKKWTRSSVARAARVIAVSESTKNDLVSLYEVPADKITVVYNGFDSEIYHHHGKKPHPFLPSHALTPQSYLLFVGTLQPRKNVLKLVQAFHLLKKDGYRGKLVIAGKIGWMATETLDAIKASPYAKDILLTGYIDTELKVALYQNAAVFVLPSLYEGFGVPALEAMACGCPVAVSDNSALPEVVGEAGMLFDGSDAVAIQDAIAKILAARTPWIKKGLKQSQKFSWDKAAQETLAVLTNSA